MQKNYNVNFARKITCLRDYHKVASQRDAGNENAKNFNSDLSAVYLIYLFLLNIVTASNLS